MGIGRMRILGGMGMGLIGWRQLGALNPVARKLGGGVAEPPVGRDLWARRR